MRLCSITRPLGEQNMSLKIIDPESSDWPDLLHTIRHDVYHLPGYIQLEAQRLQAIPEAILITEGDHQFFMPYLLRSCRDLADGGSDSDPGTANLFDAMSPYGYPGFLLSESAAKDTTGFRERALVMLKQACHDRGICSLFLRLHPILNQDIQGVWDTDMYIEHGETVSIDLTLSLEKIWAHTRKGHQSSINRCKRLGFTARMVDYTEYLDTFLDIYEETMNRAHAQAEYYFDRSYFEQLATLGEGVHLCIVELDQQIVATSILFESGGIVQAHLGGTRTEFMGQSPFMELLDYVRLWAKERGNEYFHIGGGIGGKKDNLYTFKSGFSRQRHKFHTIRLVTDQANYAHLVQQRATVLNTQAETLIESGFFPAYRASM